MEREPKSVDVADFVANWPGIVEELKSGVTSGVDVTQDGHVVALVRPPALSLHGYLKGSVKIPEGCDLAAPVFEGGMHAESGRVHE